jgi:hypothetical protein
MSAEVKQALDMLTEKVGKKVNELEIFVMDLAKQSAPGWSAGQVGDGVSGQRKIKSFGELFLETQQTQDLLSGQCKASKATLTGASLLIKNTISGDTGSPGAPDDVMSPASRLPYIVPGGSKQLRLLNAIRIQPADSNQVAATRENVYTNAAAGQAREGSAKAESDITFDLVQKPVVTLAHYVRASTQVLEDSQALRGYIDGRLVYGILDRLEYEILRGDGTAGSFDGLTKAGNFTAITPATGDAATDTIRKAITALELAGYQAGAIILNPSDFAAIEIEKASTGLYILGDGGSARLVTEGLARRIWGVPVIASTHMQAGKVIVSDLSAGAILWDRMQPTVSLGWTGDDFTSNQLVLLCEMRGALTVNQPLAIRYGNLTV